MTPRIGSRGAISTRRDRCGHGRGEGRVAARFYLRCTGIRQACCGNSALCATAPRFQLTAPAATVVTFPGSPFRLHQPFAPAGDQPEAIDKLIEGIERRPRLPDAARRHRLGQDLHDGERDRAASAGRRWCSRPTRRSRRSSTPSSASSSPRTRSSTSSPTTTTTSPRPTSRRATSTSRRTRASTSTSSRCGCRRPSRCSSARDTVIVATVSCIYGIGDPVDYHGMILHLREREQVAAARRHRAPGGDAVRAQRARLPPRHLPRARRRDRRLPGGALRARRCASRCSTTRSSSCTLFDPLTGQIAAARSRASRSIRRATT